ncbi:MAG TPA: PEP-CTERM sorting domain-containing protein [Alphaproteobacteria bacterium]|nr:PEP-CTERM sorting domain-containing protein [Alphaproteobacteria bacterium]
MGDGNFELQFLTDDGFENTVSGTYVLVGGETSVSEPASALLLGAGLAAVAWRRQRA